MMAAAATMFAACTQSDFVNEVPETSQAIGFENYVGKSTRAEIDEIADLEKVGGKMYVWGWKTDASSTTYAIFGTVNAAGTEVYYDAAADTKWNYAEKKYWDKESTYDFYAVAPAAPDGVTYTIDNTKKIKITGATSAAAADATDYLIDRNGDEGHLGEDGGIVPFDFSHVMTKVEVKVRTDLDPTKDEVKLQALTMSNWNSNAGTFTQVRTAAPDVATYNDEWSIATGNAGSAAYLTGGDLTLSNADEGESLGSWIIVPQDVTSLTFTVSFTVDGETFKNHTGTIANQQWGADSHYTYTITVGPEAIEFDVTSVKGWATNNGTDGELDIQ